MESDALSLANKMLAEKGKSFHWARHFLSATHAARATRLYGFCRYLDDLADEAASISTAREMLAEAERGIEAGRSNNAALHDGIRLTKECGISPNIALELVNGIVSDLEFARIADESDLMRYCYRVAGTVGVMMCGVLDVHNKEAIFHAIDLGIAMQLTNICRDVSEDATAGRRYLPASMIGEFPPNELVHPTPTQQPLLRKCVGDILATAEHYYSSGENGLAYLPFRARCGILVAARVYRAIGSRLKKWDYEYWQGRAVVTPKEKAKITAQALLGKIWHQSFWQKRFQHDARLHAALGGLPFTETSHAT